MGRDCKSLCVAVMYVQGFSTGSNKVKNVSESSAHRDSREPKRGRIICVCVCVWRPCVLSGLLTAPHGRATLRDEFDSLLELFLASAKTNQAKLELLGCCWKIPSFRPAHWSPQLSFFFFLLLRSSFLLLLHPCSIRVPDMSRSAALFCCIV